MKTHLSCTPPERATHERHPLGFLCSVSRSRPLEHQPVEVANQAMVSTPPRGLRVAFAGFTLVLHTNNTLTPFVVAHRLPHRFIANGPPLPCSARWCFLPLRFPHCFPTEEALGGFLGGGPTVSGVSPRAPLGSVPEAPCRLLLKAVLPRPSGHAPGHQVVSIQSCRTARRSV